MSHWKPISTAPKTGESILAFGIGVKGFPSAWNPDRPKTPMTVVIWWVEGWYDKDVPVADGLFRKERTQGYAYWSPHPQQFEPTHWMPLPEAPNRKTQ